MRWPRMSTWFRDRAWWTRRKHFSKCCTRTPGKIMASFLAKQLGFAYGLHEASFEFPRSGLITIAGPNGAGKSTLLGILAGLRTPYHGSCLFAGREVRQWSKREFA